MDIISWLPANKLVTTLLLHNHICFPLLTWMGQVPYIPIIFVYTIASHITRGPTWRAISIKVTLISLIIILGRIYLRPAFIDGSRIPFPTALALEAALTGVCEATLFNLIFTSPVELRHRLLHRTTILVLCLLTCFVLPLMMEKFNLPTHRRLKNVDIFDSRQHGGQIMLHAVTKEFFIFLLPSTFARISSIEHPILGRVLTQQRFGTHNTPPVPANRIPITFMHYAMGTYYMQISRRMFIDSLTLIAYPFLPNLASTNAEWARTAEMAHQGQRQMGRALLLLMTGRFRKLWNMCRQGWAGLNMESFLFLTQNIYYISIGVYVLTLMSSIVPRLRRYIDDFRFWRAQTRVMAGDAAAPL